MFQYLMRQLRLWQLLNQKQKKRGYQARRERLARCLSVNLQAIQQRLGSSSDIVIRKFRLGHGTQTAAALVFINGLVSKEGINRQILEPLMREATKPLATPPGADLLETLQERVIPFNEVKTTGSLEQLVDAVLGGETALLVDGFNRALLMDTKGWDKRGVEKPDTEGVVRGPRQGFSEDILTNTVLLRRIVHDPRFTLESWHLGRRTRTEVVVAYLKGVAGDPLLAEIRRRLQRIDIDAILESGYIEQLVEDAPFSIFPTVANSERPDKVAAKILEGRAAILVDGTPFVLTVPSLFIEAFQNTEDYYARPYVAVLARLVRLLAFALSVLSPALYVALTTFHQELIPTPLLITVAAAREGIPFPSVVETVMMIIVFEILREASVRMPRPLGQAVNIVGALVIGQAAVSAGLVGAPMVIVVAITAVTSFIVPPLSESGAVLRLIFALAAGVLGLFGIGICLLQVLVRLASLRSFGVPYLFPVTPLSLEGMKDTLVRAPLWSMLWRPTALSQSDSQRQSPGSMPRPPVSRPRRRGRIRRGEAGR